MFKLKFINSQGESIEIYDRPFRLIRFDGLGDTGADHQTQKSYNQDGVTLYGTHLEDKHLEIELMIVGIDEIDLAQNRRKILSMFNPKLGEGTLQRISADGTRQINAVADGVPFFPDGPSNRSKTFQRALISLYCPNPYWTDTTDRSIEIVTWIGGLTFPLRLPTEFATAGENVGNIINDGDVETPLRIEITGPATNPKITKQSTGEYLRIKETLTAEDTLVITTGFGNKRVELNGENAFNLLDLPESTFFNLHAGDNIVFFTTENINDNATIRASYRNRYVGV